MKIAFLTSSNYQGVVDQCPDFLNEYEILKPLFAAKGAELVKADWCDASLDLSQFQGLIPKACWDYTEKPAEFLEFLERVQASGVPMQNSVAIVKWNMRKTYLEDLKAVGLNVGELLVIDQTKSGFSLSETEHQFFRSPLLGATELVAKPSIGAAAVDAIRFPAGELFKQEEHFNKILAYSDLILQPFFPEIAFDGEYSFFFFGGEFAHAIHKIPKQGDFRAHQLFGAENKPYTPNSSEIFEASVFISGLQKIFKGAGEVAYGRVDVFKREGRMFLIELELIEPYLYFEVGTADSAKKFVHAVLRAFQ